MLIDDDEVTNFINLRRLERTGWVQQVLIARNGRLALDLIEERLRRKIPLPKLILLDINMPVMGGLDFLTAYQELELPENPPVVVVLTSLLNPADQERAGELGVEDFLGKPLDAQDLEKLKEKYFLEDRP